MFIINYPRLYPPTSSSPPSLTNDQETNRFSPLSSTNDHSHLHSHSHHHHHQDSSTSSSTPPIITPTSTTTTNNLSLPSYADLTPVIHSTPLPSFETLNRSDCYSTSYGTPSTSNDIWRTTKSSSSSTTTTTKSNSLH